MYTLTLLKADSAGHSGVVLRTLEPSLQESVISEFARFMGADVADRLSG
jgi:hypothetical protein